jgi:hypothetical protein
MASLSSARSTAITREAPHAWAPSRALKPTPPSPTTATVSPARTLAVFTAAPTPGQHGAAEQGRDLVRKIGLDLHQRTARDHRVFGEGRDADMMMHRPAMGRQPSPAADEFADAVGGIAGLAQRRPPFAAGRAMAAGRHEDHDHAVAGFQVVYARTRLDDLARGLMAEHHRHRAGPVAIDDGEVRMA